MDEREGVDVGSVQQEQVHEGWGGVFGGVHEGRGFEGVVGVHVRAVGEEEGGHF